MADKPFPPDKKVRRVEIVMLKFNEAPEIINECINRIVHYTEWPYRLTIYDNRPNTSNTSKAWNKLVRESPCEYIMFIDTDAFVEKTKPCWLTRMMEDIDDKCVVVPMGDKVGGSNKATGAKDYPSFRDQNGIWSGFCFLIKKSILDKIGWFDERFNLYGQDSEFAFRVLKHLGGAQYREDVFIRHLGGYSARKANEEGTFDREADHLYANSLYRILTKQSNK